MFSSFTRNSSLANGNHRGPIGTELSRLPHSSSNPGIIGLAEVILDSKGDHTRPANDWLCLWPELYSSWKPFRQPSSGLKRSGNSWQSCLHESWRTKSGFSSSKIGSTREELGFPTCVTLRSAERLMPKRTIASRPKMLSCATLVTVNSSDFMGYMSPGNETVVSNIPRVGSISRNAPYIGGHS